MVATECFSSPPFYGANIHNSPLKLVRIFSRPVYHRYLCLPHSRLIALARMGNIAMVLILISGYLRHDHGSKCEDGPPASP